VAAAFEAGLAYFATVFAVGFALGTLRVLVVVPRVGEMAGLLIELPIMLLVSWVVCGWLLKRFSVQNKPSRGLLMGAVAFALLMVAELWVSVFAFGRSLAEHFESYRSLNAILGLAAQVAFAAFGSNRAGHASKSALGLSDSSARMALPSKPQGAESLTVFIRYRIVSPR
jgi:hypothetical protein